MGGWVGCWRWCESRRSQPDQRRHSCSLRYRHLLSSPLTLKKKNKNKQKTKQKNPKPATVAPQWPAYTLPGMTASTSAHACSHTLAHCSQSLCPGEEFFLSFFCLFFTLRGFSSFFCWERGGTFFFSFKWEQRGRWLIVKGWGGRGV